MKTNETAKEREFSSSVEFMVQEKPNYNNSRWENFTAVDGPETAAIAKIRKIEEKDAQLGYRGRYRLLKITREVVFKTE